MWNKPQPPSFAGLDTSPLAIRGFFVLVEAVFAGKNGRGSFMGGRLGLSFAERWNIGGLAWGLRKAQRPESSSSLSSTMRGKLSHRRGDLVNALVKDLSSRFLPEQASGVSAGAPSMDHGSVAQGSSASRSTPASESRLRPGLLDRFRYGCLGRN